MATKATESDDEDPRGLAPVNAELPTSHPDPLIYPELGILAVCFIADLPSTVSA